MKRQMKWVVAGGLVIAGVSGIGYAIWQSRNQAQVRKIAFARDLIESGRSDQAIDLLTHAEPPTPHSREEVSQLRVEALRRTGNLEGLRDLYYDTPEAFDENEEASLLIARFLLVNDDEPSCLAIEEKWRERRQLAPQWFELEIDRRLRAGEPADAAQMLEANSFGDENDAGRLTRLALLHASEPYKAWKYLEEAYQADSSNTTVRVFRGNLLEAAGRRAEARVEYVAAYAADPSDVLMADQLAEFYRRIGDYASAQKTWAQIPNDTVTDYVELKRRFWSRLATPMSAPRRAVPQGPWRKFAEFMETLPRDGFWDESAFRELNGYMSISKIRQEPFWLHLMQKLQDSEGKRDRLEYARWLLVESRVGSSYSYSHDLYRGLMLALTYRLDGQLAAEGLISVEPTGLSRRHQVFDALDRAHFECLHNPENYSLPDDLKALIQDPNVFAILAMATGWTEAAIRLDTGDPISEGAPSWAAYGMTQAYRMNRGEDAALEYARKQNPTSLMSLLRGELHLAQGDVESAKRFLIPLASTADDAGIRAAWLLSGAYLESGQVEEAESVVEGNAKLSASVLGQETLAKAAIARGDAELAERIYTGIRSHSFEATAFETRRAVARRSWDEAAQLTRKLLEQMPGNLQLLQNLRAIENARRNDAQ